jgi:hypothetical protein
MKVVLSRSAATSLAGKTNCRLYPDGSIELISRAEFENGSHSNVSKRLRALRPDVLAMRTERLPWQRGQQLLHGLRRARGRARSADARLRTAR